MSAFCRSLRLAVLSLGVGALAACSSPVGPEPAPAEPTPPAAPAVPTAPGIYPGVAVQAAGAGEVRVELRLQRVRVDQRVASYQGDLAFRTAGLTLDRVEFPEGIAGAANQDQPGRVRFAGTALDGIPGEVMVVLHFRAAQAPPAGDFTMRLEELTAAGEFQSLTALINQPPAASLALGRAP